LVNNDFLQKFKKDIYLVNIARERSSIHQTLLQILNPVKSGVRPLMYWSMKNPVLRSFTGPICLMNICFCLNTKGSYSLLILPDGPMNRIKDLQKCWPGRSSAILGFQGEITALKIRRFPRHKAGADKILAHPSPNPGCMPAAGMAVSGRWPCNERCRLSLSYYPPGHPKALPRTLPYCGFAVPPRTWLARVCVEMAAGV
jgi:hypothetical protein